MKEPAINTQDSKAKTHHALLETAEQAMHHAYAPCSGFTVGAALLAEDGTVTAGCNVENTSYGLTVCAERVALLSAVAAGRRGFKAMAIVADDSAPYPCGACRQVMSEFCGPDFEIYVASSKQVDRFEKFALGELLPHTFRLPDKSSPDVTENVSPGHD